MNGSKTKNEENLFEVAFKMNVVENLEKNVKNNKKWTTFKDRKGI